MLVTPDTSQKKEVRSRLRASTSCIECRRRKQKCNQARPCNNCSRRYPPVTCAYEIIKKSSKYKERVVDLTVASVKVEGLDEGSPEFHTISHPPTKSRSHTPLYTPHLQLSYRHPSRCSWNSSSGSFEIPKESVPLDKFEPGCQDDFGRDISSSIGLRQFHRYPESYQSPYHCNANISAHGIAPNPLQYLPVEVSKRNAELLHFFKQRLSSYMSSIDGTEPSQAFNDQWLPFITQSPIAIYVPILSSCYFQASARRIPVEKSVEVIAAKGKLINLINEHIVSHSRGVNDDSIAAVMSLTYTELIYADERSTLAHMRGLRDMIRTRGGIENLSFSLLPKLLLRTDYQVACTFECDLFLHDAERSAPIPCLQSYPLHINSPLLLSRTPFTSPDVLEVLGISLPTARILDDVRFLTTSVVNLNSNTSCEESKVKFLATVHWIHTRLTSPSSYLEIDPSLDETHPDPDPIYQTVHVTALIYTIAILTRTPLSVACTPAHLATLWSQMWRVPMSRWKQIPGIFFFVLQVANPFARDKPEGRFLKGLMPSSAITIGLAEWGALVAMLRAFFGVQRWLGGELRDVMNDGEGAEWERGRENVRFGTERVPEGGVPAWSMANRNYGRVDEVQGVKKSRRKEGYFP